MAKKKAEKEQEEFPMEVKSGSVLVKIYKVENKERESFMVSYFVGTQRKRKMFAEFGDAKKHAKSVGDTISNGEHDVLELRSKDLFIYQHAKAALAPLG